MIEIAFALHGFPAVPRYMFEAGAVIAVLAGVFAGRVVLEVPALIARAARGIKSRRLGPAALSRVGGWGAALVLVVFAGALLPAARSQLREERVDLKHEHARTAEINRLSTVVRTLGPARILACGQPNIPIGYQSQLAWYLGVKIGALYVGPGYLKLHPHPLVNLYPIRGGGWKVFPSHINAAAAPRCQGLHRIFRF